MGQIDYSCGTSADDVRRAPTQKGDEEIFEVIKRGGLEDRLKQVERAHGAGKLANAMRKLMNAKKVAQRCRCAPTELLHWTRPPL